ASALCSRGVIELAILTRSSDESTFSLLRQNQHAVPLILAVQTPSRKQLFETGSRVELYRTPYLRNRDSVMELVGVELLAA
ncbi:MAG: hypothetical protein V3T78_07375, partial [Dehalococcoidia bacterium]